MYTIYIRVCILNIGVTIYLFLNISQKNLIIYQICENKMGLNLIKLILHSKLDLAIVAKI